MESLEEMISTRYDLKTTTRQNRFLRRIDEEYEIVEANFHGAFADHVSRVSAFTRFVVIIPEFLQLLLTDFNSVDHHHQHPLGTQSSLRHLMRRSLHRKPQMQIKSMEYYPDLTKQQTPHRNGSRHRDGVSTATCYFKMLSVLSFCETRIS